MRDADVEAGTLRANARIGEFMASLSEGRGVQGLPDGVLTGFRLRLPTEQEPSVLLVIRAESAEGRHIAFVGAFSVFDALLAWRSRCQGAAMKWREDVPWDER